MAETMTNIWQRFPTEWIDALNEALVREFDFPIAGQRPRIVHGGFLMGVLSRWPFKAQAATITETINLSWRWDRLKLSSDREAFLTLGHETVHVCQQGRHAPWLPRWAAFWLRWLPAYLWLAVWGCVKAWTHWRPYQPSRDHRLEASAYDFEAWLRERLP